DRIVLSENLNQPNVAALIAPFGVSVARFFINGVDTTTKGIDVVLRQRFNAGPGRLDLTASANFNDTEVTKLPSTDVLSSLNPPPVLFGRVNTLTFEEGTPDSKISVAGDWSQPLGSGDFGVTLKGTYYGDVTEPGVAANGSQDIDVGSHLLVDLELRARLGFGLGFAIGVDNLLDEYPNEVPAALNPQAALGFSRYSPFGFNGRFYYGRMSFSW
ncbi:MAG TPA: TonB-dependent receptor, partial [Povalibacter sp.]|nr:TonB-dependent receptor [Povalibacter sp.]